MQQRAVVTLLAESRSQLSLGDTARRDTASRNTASRATLLAESRSQLSLVAAEPKLVEEVKRS
jgi:hypothetical protein